MKKICLFFLILVFLCCQQVLYSEVPERFKAIVVVKRVTVVESDEGEGEEELSVQFDNEFSLSSEDIPHSFTANCMSVISGSTPYDVGKTKYFTPKMGQRALVEIEDGMIVDYRKVSLDEERKLVSEKRNGKLFMDQVFLQKSDSEKESVTIFELTRKLESDRKVRLTVRHDEMSYIEVLESEINAMKAKIRTEFRGLPSFELVSHSVSEEKPREIRFYTTKSRRIPEGKIWGTVKFGITSNTMTDFLLFEYVRWMPFEKAAKLKLHVIESTTGELHRDMELCYEGSETGKLHTFVLYDRKGKEWSRYRVSEKRQLMEVRMSDKSKYVRKNWK